MKLSPQKEIIVSTLRDLKWHCGREWLDRIKDDRKRIGELNDTYMKSKGFEIQGRPCKGKACGKKDCPLFMRRAEPRFIASKNTFDKEKWKSEHPKTCEACKNAKELLRTFNTA